MRAHLLLGVAALTLGACKLDRDPTPAADQAQLTAGAPFELGLAPAFGALPPAEPVPVLYAPQPVAYDYWNDAYDMNQTYYNQPPAYFDYAGATPMVWGQPQQQQGLGGALTNMVITRIVEALVGGGQREYFYQPGAENPYFIRDPQYAYAVDDGRLVALYDPYGRLLPEPMLVQRAPVVSRYLVRSDNIYDAALAATLRPLAPDIWDRQRVVLIDQLDDNDGWRSTWIPGADRSPVAIRRLAEVRARKEARDEAHALWKARLDATRPAGKAPRFTFVDRDDDERRFVRVTAGDKDRGGSKARADRDDKRDGPKANRDDDNRGGPKARAERDPPKAEGKKGDDQPKAQKRAEANHGGGKKENDRGGGEKGGGNGKGNGKNG